jgi:hypothetical protein
MSEVTTTPAVLPTFDVSHVEDPEVRRLLRSMQAEVASKTAQLQLQLDSVLEVLIDKHITSISEFKREIARLGQNHVKTDRLHEAISGSPPVMASVKPPLR